MTTEREFNRSHATQLVTHVDEDFAPNRTTKSSRLDAPKHPQASGLIMRKAARDGNGVADGAEDLVATASSDSGSALPTALMRKFESSLGADLSSVRVHTGGASADAASAVGAKAYTIGQDIHFGAGHYDPSSSDGQHLLAHEVAHTVQQRGGTPTRQNKLEVSSPGDHLEAEADHAATAMVSGQSFAVTSGGAFQRKVFRDANPAAAAQDDGKVWIDLPPVKIATNKFTYVKFDVQFKGKIGIQFSNTDASGKAAAAPVTGGAVFSPKGGGVKSEIDLAKDEFVAALLGMNFQGKTKEKFSFELSQEQFKVAIGTEGRVAWEKLPWLQGAVDANFIFAGVKWADLQNDPDSVKVAAVDAAFGLAGQGEYRGKKITTAAQIVVTGSPNWARIAAEAAKQGARTGATAAGSATTATAAAGGAADAAMVAGMVDTGAVAAGAAALILPLGVAAIMVAGGAQTEKNIVASRAAIAAGHKMRGEVDQYVSSYLDALAGRSATGAGAIEGNAKVEAYMSATGKTREQAGLDLIAHNGGRDKLKADLTTQMRDRLYAAAVTWFEENFAGQFGLLEKWGGESWGMRGVFRKDLRLVLYGGDATPTATAEDSPAADEGPAVASQAGTAAPEEEASGERHDDEGYDDEGDSSEQVAAVGPQDGGASPESEDGSDPSSDYDA